MGLLHLYMSHNAAFKRFTLQHFGQFTLMRQLNRTQLWWLRATMYWRH